MPKKEVSFLDITLCRMLSLIPKKPDGKYVHGAKKEFCNKIGAPTNIISEWETGKTKSYRNYIYVVAMTFGVSVEWLKGETDIKEKPVTVPGDELSESKRYLIEMVPFLSEAQAKMLRVVIEQFLAESAQ